MAQALIAGAGVAVDGALKLNEQLMKRKGSDSSRSCGILFRNTSNRKLYVTGSGLSHGVWTTKAPIPTEIPAGKLVAWMSESQGFMTGTQGWANFSFDPHTEWDVNINWNVPYVGQNSYDAKINNNSDFRITPRGGQGDNATFNITFSGVDPSNEAEEDDEGPEDEDEGGDESGDESE
jgi:hypothetical protein